MDNDEIKQAREAQGRGDFLQARHHLSNAKIAGADHAQIDDYLQELDTQKAASAQACSKRHASSVAAAVAGYIILSFASPPSWTVPVWAVLTFIVVPAFAGVLAGNSAFSESGHPTKADRFWRAFKVVGVTVGIYSLVNMINVRGDIQSSDKSMDIAIFLFVALTYAAVAGCVGGAAGAFIPARRRTS